MKRKVIAAMLTLLSATMVCPTAYAATEHYNDSSVTGDAEEWQAYKDNWEPVFRLYKSVPYSGKRRNRAEFCMVQ